MTEPDKLNRWLVGSAVLHGGLFAMLLVAPILLPSQASETWGGENAGLEGINAKIVGSSGIALPAPEVTNDDAAANDSKGFYKTETPPPDPPKVEEAAEKIPEKNAPAPKKIEAKKTVEKAPPKTKTPEPEVPANAVPYGNNGNPSIGYGQAAQTGPAGAAGFGDGAFGT